MPKKIKAVGGKITPLGGDAEDMVKALLEYKINLLFLCILITGRGLPADILKSSHQRKISWDYYAKSLIFFSRDSNTAPAIYPVPDNFDRNDMFVDEIKEFISVLKGEKESLIPLQQGMSVLEISLKIKEQIGFK